jgi:hypothetical protein
MLLVTDDDDTSYDRLHWPLGVRTCIIPRLHLAAKINQISLEQAPYYTAIFPVGDDHTFDTPHWDTIMMAELEKLGGTGIVCPDDKRRADIGEISMISSDIILALGWFSHPSLKHYWADNVVNDIGRHAKCIRYCSDVVIEHHHYSVDARTPHDDTYKYGESFGAEDAQAYQTWRHEKMDADVAIVQKLLRTKKFKIKM